MKQNPSPEEFIPKFRRKKLDEPGFLRKLARFAGRLGAPAIKQLYALYFLFKEPSTPKRAKMIILGALVYFFSPIDSIPDLLGPLGFTDDIAVIALVYSQMKAYLTEEIRDKARAATEELLRK
ncbi:YkvA family protein [Neisseria sp. S1]|uniref:YkvA family protein n=1 Tax=Neisseria sp. S1 TaxID=3318354 RepID=UPI003A8B218F